MSTVNFPASYIREVARILSQSASDVKHGLGLNIVHRELTIIATDLRLVAEAHAAPSFIDADGNRITVEWCEGTLSFAVCSDGLPMDSFTSYAEAQRFANDLSTGAKHGKAAG